MGFATIEGRNVFYQFPSEAEANVRQGHTVLMVHGAYDDHRVWRYQYSYLERGNTPISIDLPGHGSSEGPTINKPEEFRSFIKAFVDIMGLSPFVFAGHSMGGSMALDYAIHHPDDVKGLVLVGSAPYWKLSNELIELWKTDPEAARSRNLDYLFSKQTHKRIRTEYGNQLASTSVEACLADSENCVLYDLGKFINAIKSSALVICGDEEEWIQGSKEIQAELSNSRLEVVQGAGHAILIEQPILFNDAMGSYLGALD